MKSPYLLLGVLLLAVGAAFYFASPEDVSNSDESMETKMTLTSPAFGSGGVIPSKYACDGENVNPPLAVEGVPSTAVSLVLIMDDPDVPKKLKPDGVFDHWVLYNIPPSTREIKEASTAGTDGLNGRGETGYLGPCPPREYEPTEHRYFFRLYALDSMLEFADVPTKREVRDALSGHVIAEAELMGRYERTGE